MNYTQQQVDERNAQERLVAAREHEAFKLGAVWAGMTLTGCATGDLMEKALVQGRARMPAKRIRLRQVEADAANAEVLCRLNGEQYEYHAELADKWVPLIASVTPALVSRLSPLNGANTEPDGTDTKPLFRGEADGEWESSR